MSAGVLWETEPQLESMPGNVRVLVCGECGAILKRRVDGAAARVIGVHADGCRAWESSIGQPGLFA